MLAERLLRETVVVDPATASIPPPARTAELSTTLLRTAENVPALRMPPPELPTSPPASATPPVTVTSSRVSDPPARTWNTRSTPSASTVAPRPRTVIGAVTSRSPVADMSSSPMRVSR